MPAREYPILFSGELVRAIFAGRKTQTRRVVRPQPAAADEAFFWSSPSVPSTRKADEGLYTRDRSGLKFVQRSPFGVPGDRLWVRETWYCDHFRCRSPFGAHPPELIREFTAPGMLAHRATHDCRDWEAGCPCDHGEWRPSIHMPRWACRITLRVTDVRVERLQDISEADALAEGVAIDKGHAYAVAGHEEWVHKTARGCFATLWDSIYRTKPGCAVADNPWVWVVSFEREEVGA